MFYFAYLDPGTGSLILQAVVGAILGIIVVMRNHIRLAIGKVRNIGKKPKAAKKIKKD